MPPTIVLIHGAFAESASWDAVIDRLLDAGHDVIAAANPLRGLATDAAVGQRRRPVRRGPGPARRPLLRRRRDLERRRRRRRDHRARLRQRLRPGAWRELLRAGGQVPRQHARRADASAGAAHRRHDRSVHRAGPRSTTCSARTCPPRRPQRLAVTQRPATQEALVEPSGERPAVGRAAVLVPDRRGGPHHPAGAPALHGASAQARARTIEIPGASHAAARLTTRRDRESDPRGRCVARHRVIVRHEQAKGTDMKIVVIGGTGLIGSKLVDKLERARPRGGRGVARHGRQHAHRRGPGRGRSRARRSSSTCRTRPSFEDAAVLEFFETSTRNLLAAEAAAGVDITSRCRSWAPSACPRAATSAPRSPRRS